MVIDVITGIVKTGTLAEEMAQNEDLICLKRLIRSNATCYCFTRNNLAKRGSSSKCWKVGKSTGFSTFQYSRCWNVENFNFQYFNTLPTNGR